MDIQSKAKHLLLAATLAIGASQTASAQGLPGGATALNETHGDWTVGCQSAEAVTRCSLSQTQVRNENRQRVLTVELIVGDNGETAQGTLVLPFGLRLADGVNLVLDENTQIAAARFSTCVPAGCLVPLSFDAAATSALRAGSTLGIKAITNDTGQEFVLSISLHGFTAALARSVELTRQ